MSSDRYARTKIITDIQQMRICFRCKNSLKEDTDNKTCEACIQYIGQLLTCERCGFNYTRTNRNRHYRSFECRVSIFIEIE